MSFDTRNQGKASIEKTYLVQIPNGETNEVNVFDLNLAIAGDPESYVQLADGGWIKAKNCTLVKGA